MRLKMCVYDYPDEEIVGEELICRGGVLHGKGGAREMVEHRITHWNISAEQAVLSFAGWFNGYLYAVVVRRTKDGDVVVRRLPTEPQQDTLF